VAIVCIVGEELLYLISQHLDVIVDFFVTHAVKHRDRTQSLDFAHSTEGAELGVGQSHVLFVSLCDLPLLQRTQLSSGSRMEDLVNNFEFVDLVEVSEDFFESEL